MSQIIPLGKATHRIPMLVKDAGGQLVNADALPSVLNVQKNGVDADEATVTIVQAQDATPANITGHYLVSADLSGGGLNAAANDDISIVIQATVAGTVLSSTHTFTVASLSGNAPSLELG